MLKNNHIREKIGDKIEFSDLEKLLYFNGDGLEPPLNSDKENINKSYLTQ